jgi:hypothetical protein
VLFPPSWICLTFARCAHFDSSTLRRVAISSFAFLRASLSASDRIVFSDFLSRKSIMKFNRSLSILYFPLSSLAQPRRYYLRWQILFCQLIIGLSTVRTELHSLSTISLNPSCFNHESSNENSTLFPIWDCSPVSNNNGVWSEPDRGKA